MVGSLVELVRVVRTALVSFDPGVYSGENCAELVEELAAPRHGRGLTSGEHHARGGYAR